MGGKRGALRAPFRTLPPPPPRKCLAMPVVLKAFIDKKGYIYNRYNNEIGISVGENKKYLKRWRGRGVYRYIDRLMKKI